jgi:hypothetical protein
MRSRSGCLIVAGRRISVESWAAGALHAALSVSRQAVTKLLSSAEWQGLHVAIRQFEKTDWREVLDVSK